MLNDFTASDHDYIEFGLAARTVVSQGDSSSDIKWPYHKLVVEALVRKINESHHRLSESCTVDEAADDLNAECLSDGSVIRQHTKKVCPQCLQKIGSLVESGVSRSKENIHPV